VGNLGGIRSVEKNLKMVTVLLMVAAYVRNLVMKKRYVFLMFLSPTCHQQRQHWVVSGKSFGNGVVLMGMPVIEVWALFTIFHGLNDGFVAVVDWVFPFMLCVVVILFVTAITIDSSLLSLLLVFIHSCWLDGIVFWLALEGLDMVLSVLSLFACGACGCFCCSVAEFA